MSDHLDPHVLSGGQEVLSQTTSYLNTCLTLFTPAHPSAGALWQFVGTRASSPTPFLAARLVDRGGDAPLLSSAVQPQPERGSPLTAGGVKPGGFWSGAVSMWLLADNTAVVFVSALATHSTAHLHVFS